MIHAKIDILVKNQNNQCITVIQKKVSRFFF